MDIEGGSTLDGGNLLQWDYHGADNQKFEFIPLGGGVYQILSVHSGKVLDVEGASTDNGANVLQWAIQGNSNQLFKVTDAGNGYCQLTALHSNKVVEVEGGSNNAGANIIQWDNNNQDHSLWKLIQLGTKESTALNIVKSSGGISLFPNPVIDFLEINGATVMTKYEVFNLSGIKVLEGTGPKISFNKLPEGIYFITINDVGTTFIDKIIKK